MRTESIVNTYQQSILDRLGDLAVSIGENVGVSVVYNFANSGRLIAHDTKSIRTLATIDFDFQTKRVNASLNGGVQVGQPKIGPRSNTVFWWSPGDAEDDHEVKRLLDTWIAAVAAEFVRS